MHTKTHLLPSLLTQRLDRIDDEREFLAPTLDTTLYRRSASSHLPDRHPLLLYCNEAHLVMTNKQPTNNDQADDADDMYSSAKSFPPLSLHPDMADRGVYYIP